MKGYQVIELEALSPLVTRPMYDAFSVAILVWLCDSLRVEFKEHLQYVDFDIICVTYVGSYASIGIHYKDPNYEDIGPLVQESIGRMLREKSAGELASFVTKNQTDWREFASKLLSRGS